jgi:hypothetical protein
MFTSECPLKRVAAIVRRSETEKMPRWRAFAHAKK